MNGYEVIYEPEKGQRKHHTCRPSEALDYGYEIEHAKGTIICCDTCGQHWFSHYWGKWKPHGLYTVRWHKVRWFNFIKRRRIVGK